MSALRVVYGVSPVANPVVIEVRSEEELEYQVAAAWERLAGCPRAYVVGVRGHLVVSGDRESRERHWAAQQRLLPFDQGEGDECRR